jgi:hypothetical protein
MVAGLLYIIGLISALVTIILVGLNAPPIIQAFTAALQAPNPDYLAAVSGLGRGLGWAFTPFVGGLLLMAAGRIVSLLSAINRALRGTP